MQSGECEGVVTKNWFKDEIAEGRTEIMALCGLTSWRGVLLRKHNKLGFRSLFRTNPVNDKPFIIVREYYEYIMEYNKLKKNSKVHP